MLEWLSEFLKFEWLSEVPLFWANGVAIILFVGIALWAAIQKRAYVFAGASDGVLWRDLRIWALLAMAIQVTLYILFA